MPTLREAQNFFYNLMARPEVIGRIRKNRERTLKRFFRSENDREALRHVPLERFQTYRNHISIGFLGAIESAFPVLRSLVSRDEWNGLLNDFYLKRLTRSPIARQVFREFAHYLQDYRGPLLKRLPYLKELAEYENLEIRLFYDPDRPAPESGKGLIRDWREAAGAPEEFVRLIPSLNPHRALRRYRWPVHRVCRGFSSPRRVKPGRYALLVYRDPETFQIRFLEMNPLVAELVNLMASERNPIGRVLETLLKRHKPAEPQSFVREGVQAIRFLKDRGVVLGFRTA
ncbi:MAG TPA: putative DNA-binding domain-containing protein [bacterium]|nr:putative DNA-binding domain-containing protein [bacterium]